VTASSAVPPAPAAAALDCAAETPVGWRLRVGFRSLAAANEEVGVGAGLGLVKPDGATALVTCKVKGQAKVVSCACMRQQRMQALLRQTAKDRASGDAHRV